MDSVLEIVCGFNKDHKGNVALVIYFPYPNFMLTCIPRCLPRKKKYNPIRLFLGGTYCRKYPIGLIFPILTRKQSYKISRELLEIVVESHTVHEIITKLKEEKLLY